MKLIINKTLIITLIASLMPVTINATEKHKNCVEYVQPAVGLNVRGEAGTHNNVLTSITIGTKIEILETKEIDSKDEYDKWHKIEYKDNEYGWISAHYTDEEKPVYTLSNPRDYKSQSSSSSITTSNIAVNSTGAGQAINMNLSFYGDVVGTITASGEKVKLGVAASNVYPIGTQFEIGEMTFTVLDRGGPHFDDPNRLDIFVPRLSGESDSAYIARMRELGRMTVTAYKK